MTNVELIDQEELGGRADEFLFDAPAVGNHVLALYALRPVAQQQFAALEQAGVAGPPLLGIVGAVIADGGGRTLPLAALTPNITPQRLQEMFTSVPLVTLTTLGTTREPEARDLVLELDRALVLVDLPLRLQVKAWVESSGIVRFRAISLQGEPPLTQLVFRLDELPQIHSSASAARPASVSWPSYSTTIPTTSSPASSSHPTPRVRSSPRPSAC